MAGVVVASITVVAVGEGVGVGVGEISRIAVGEEVRSDVVIGVGEKPETAVALTCAGVIDTAMVGVKNAVPVGGRRVASGIGDCSDCLLARSKKSISSAIATISLKRS